MRGLTPPHRVKSISMATFSPEEIDFLKSNGNESCAKTWLGLWDPKRIIHQDQRELMIDKYEKKRYYLEPASPLKSLTNATKVSCVNGNNNNNIINNTNKNVLALTTPSLSICPSTNNNNNKNNNNNNIDIKNSINNDNNRHNRCNFQNQFSPDENIFFNLTATTINTPNTQQNNQFSSSAINTNNHSNSSSYLVNGLNSNSNRQVINKNSLNIQPNPDKLSNLVNNNKFTPDSEFITDFSAANMFNITNNAGNSLIASKVNQTQSTKIIDVTSNQNANSIDKCANENFADFDHAPIYNATGPPISVSSTNNSLSASSTFASGTSINSTPPADRYAALKDLDEQLRDNKVFAFDAFSPSASNIAMVNPFKISPLSQKQEAGNPFQVNLNHTSYGSPAETLGTSTLNTQTHCNGYHAPDGMTNVSDVGGSSCGVRYGNQSNSSTGSNQKNPFTATSFGANNPFL